MKTVMKVLLGLVLLVSGCVGVIFWATSELPKTADAFFTALAREDYDAAIAMTTADFKASTSVADLQAFAEENGCGVTVMPAGARDPSRTTPAHSKAPCRWPTAVAFRSLCNWLSPTPAGASRTCARPRQGSRKIEARQRDRHRFILARCRCQ